MADTPVGSNALVLELLNRNNYANWRRCLQTYLLAEDLWEVVTEETEPTNFEDNDAKYKAWRKNNAKALYAIQKSCGLEMLTFIREMETAKVAWEALEQECKAVRGYDRNDVNHPVSLNWFRRNVKRGDWDGAKRCLGDIDIRSAVLTDETVAGLPIHVAAKEGHAHIVKELVPLMMPEDLKRKYNGETALHIAARCGHVDVVKVLLPLMEDVKDDDGGNTALHIAVREGKVDVVKVLLQGLMRQEGLKIQNDAGYTALHIAVREGKVDVVKELLWLMRQEDLKIKNKDGRTVLHLAVNKGNVPIIREFVRKEQGDDSISMDELEPYKHFFKGSVEKGDLHEVNVFLNKLDRELELDPCNAILARDPGSDMMNALHMAARKGHVDIIKAFVLLLQRREDKLVLKTAEDFVSFGCGVTLDLDERVVMEKAKYMVEQYEKKLSTALEIQTLYKQTALYLAAASGSVDIVKELAPLMTQEGLEVRDSFNFYKTALQIAVRDGNVDIVKELVPLMRKKGLEIKDIFSGDTALHSAVSRGGNADIINLLVESMRPEGLEVQNKEGSNALHLAIKNEHPQQEIVMKLVSSMRPEALGQKDGKAYTALGWAIQYLKDDEVTLKMVECMAQIGPEVFGVPSAPDNHIPLLEALRWNKWELAHTIYHVTLIRFLEGSQGIEFLCYCLNAGRHLDLVWDLFRKRPWLGRRYIDADGEIRQFAMFRLARKSYAFINGGKHTLTWWQRWIYDCIHTKEIADVNSHVISMNGGQSGQNHVNNRNFMSSVFNLFGQFIKSLRKLCGINHIYEMKSTHRQMTEFLQCMIKESQEAKVMDMAPSLIFDEIKRLIFKDMQYGHFEFVAQLLKGNPELLDQLASQAGKGIFHLSIATRQVEIYNLIYRLEKEKRHAVATDVVNKDNTLLHYAANISSSPQSGHILDTSLQMQRELQWFQEVERVVPPEIHEYRNRSDDMTPSELFTRNHKKLIEDAESSIKGTATSCTTVGALIVTMMFAAAFTVHGESDATIGLHKIFIVSDTISLAFSTSSVITFLGILTSRYAEEDFLKSLPTKMMIGLITLFFSVASMMIAFSCAVIITLKREVWIVALSIMCTNVPIILFVWLLFPLLWKTFKFTYGRGIFDRRKNNKEVK